MILFSIFNNKIINKKIKKRGAGPAWMRRGTQGHVAAPHGPAQRAYVARLYHIYGIIPISINGSLSSPIWGGSYPYKRSGIIYPTVSIN